MMSMPTFTSDPAVPCAGCSPTTTAICARSSWSGPRRRCGPGASMPSRFGSWPGPPASATAPPAGISPTVRPSSTHWQCGAMSDWALSCAPRSVAHDLRSTPVSPRWRAPTPPSSPVRVSCWRSCSLASTPTPTARSIGPVSGPSNPGGMRSARRVRPTTWWGPSRCSGWPSSSAVHGLAVLVNAGVAPAGGLDAAVADMTGRILRGSRATV